MAGIIAATVFRVDTEVSMLDSFISQNLLLIEFNNISQPVFIGFGEVLA